MENSNFNTGTFAPLVNQREYTENEKIVLLHFFTNVDKNVYCATDALSSQLYAYLVGQYSRSSLSMRDRFLQLFVDAKKAYENSKISKEDYISLEDLADAIKKDSSIKIKFFNDKASNFLKKWGVDYGHNSLKDADTIRFAIEGVSEVFTKVIESPFPALGNFQEKSTRYMNFKKEAIIYSPILEKTKFGVKIKEYNEELMDLYEKYVPIVKDALISNKIINREDFNHDLSYKNTLNAKTFDICRYFLPVGIRTSLGASFSARTCESHISWMLSHPLEEVRFIAKSMEIESKKISPGLLSRISKNDYLEKKQEKTLKITNEIFYKKDFDEIICGIDDCNRVKLIQIDDIDTLVTASILFENVRQKGASYLDCLNRATNLPYLEKEKIIDAELGSRGKFDRFPRSMQHGKILFEITSDFGAYRDYQRHRASSQIWQGMTAIHGFDYPELIDIKGLENFRKDYENIMIKITNLSREIIKEFAYEAEYVGALGHLIKTTFQMDPGQFAYVCELRTTPQGHMSYRKIFQKVYEIVKEKAPILSKYVRVNVDVEASRIKQEERATNKKKELGLI